jgi:Ca2+/Na+ antiporter
MQDIMITLVFMMVFLMFSVYPAIKIVGFIASKRELSQKVENYMILFFTILLALMTALFMKFV